MLPNYVSFRRRRASRRIQVVDLFQKLDAAPRRLTPRKLRFLRLLLFRSSEQEKTEGTEGKDDAAPLAPLFRAAPNAHRLILARRQRQAAVAREGDEPDLVAVAFQRPQLFAGGDIPQT
jgi:hypothetical protein